MRILPGLILFLWACNYRSAEPPVYDADSLTQMMSKQLRYYFQHNNKDAPIRYLDSLRPAIIKSNNPQLEVAWNAYKGAALLFQRNADSAKYYIHKALRIAENENLPKSKAIAKIQLVAFFIQKSAFDSALHHGLEAIEISKSDELPELPFLYSQLAFLYRAADDSANFRKFLFEGLKISKDSLQIAAFSSEIGRYYIQGNQFDSAEYFYKNFHNFNQYATRYIDGRKLEDLAFLFSSQNKKEESIKLMKEAIDHYKREGLSYAWNYLSIGSTLTELGKYKEADIYLDTALFLARQNHDLENISNTLFFKSTVLLKKGKSSQAYHVLDSSYIQHLQYDTVAFRNHAQNIEANTIRKLKDEQIASLNIANEATKKVNRQRLIIIIILILSTIFLTFWGIGVMKRRKMRLLLREVELEQQMLRSLMEPHFLFNLLGNLESSFYHGNIQKASSYLKKAVTLLRLILENARQSFVPLTAEINVLECYLDLLKEQMEDSFEYEIETYPDIEKNNVLIPPMLFQPFVENAIVHGFKNLNEKGKLIISFRREGEILQCKIEDNGNGLNGNMQGMTFRLHSITITNDRLQLLGKRTGKKTKLEIVDKNLINESNGVRVIINIPFLRSA